MGDWYTHSKYNCITYFAVKLKLYLALLIIVDGSKLLEGWYAWLAQVIDKEVEREFWGVSGTEAIAAGKVGPHPRPQGNDAHFADVDLPVKIDQVQIQILGGHKHSVT